VSDATDIVERLRDLAAVTADVDEAPCSLIDGFHAAADEIERLRARIVELEAAHARLAEVHAVALGTVGPQFRLGDEPFGIEHNVPGNAPV
jgi:hypothetical protein